MTLQRLRPSDREIRYCGVVLLALAAVLLARLHPHHGVRIGDGPTLAEFCMALLAVCAGCIGASFLCVGRRLFEPVADPRRPHPADARNRRDER